LPKIIGEKRMINFKNKTSIAITILMTLTIAVTLVALPAANAHDPPWTIASYAYIVPAPNPVGVGQTAAIIMWIDTPLPNSAVQNDVRRHDYKLTITKPDGSTEVKTWPVVDDTTSVQAYQYTPDAVGVYTLKFEYAQQVCRFTDTNLAYTNDTFSAASKTTTLTVQEEPLPAATSSYPLPAEYWTRPIEGQNTDWYTVSSNFLGRPYTPGAGAVYGMPGNIQPYGPAPNSAHLMWTKPIQYGGVVGGEGVGINGNVFYTGGSYNVRYSNPLIMYGTLYYQEPYGNSGSGGAYVAVDLRTGAELWRINTTATGTNLIPSFGYLYDYESPNQHGILPNGLLIATSGSSWRAYDPRTGILTPMEITNVPSGNGIAGPQGEYIKYVLTNSGSSANPNWYLAQWNSSNVFGGGSGLSPANWYSGKVPANCPIVPGPSGSNNNWNGSHWVTSSVRASQGYQAVSTPSFDWNVSTPWSVGMSSISVQEVVLGEYVFGRNGSHPLGTGGPRFDYPSPVTIWAASLRPGSEGQLIYMKNIDTIPNPPDGGEIMMELAGEGVAVFVKLFERQWIGYDTQTGNKLWETDPPEAEFNPFGYYSFPSLIHTESETIADGKLFTGGYTGAVHCYDLYTGELLWRYEDYTGRTVFPYFTLMLGPVADGKIYIGTHEHSADTPLFKGNKVRALNVTDGSEIWAMYGWAHPYTFAVADDTLIYWNNYDHQVYAVAKGPTTMTLQAPNAAISNGQSLVVSGTIMDISAGASQEEQSRRFPNGIPAVSEESMAGWMEYVYMQKARPMDTVGVPITLSVVDTNGNYRDIGQTTSDADGFFAFNWMPDIDGQYTVYASFAGSEGYWPSHAVASFAVDPAAPTPPPTEAPAESVADMYFVPAVAGIIVAIVVVGLLLALLLLRKRP